MNFYPEHKIANDLKLKVLIYLTIIMAFLSCSEENSPPEPQTPPIATTDTLIIGVNRLKGQLIMSSDTINVLRNDYDAENDPLSIDIVSGSGKYGKAEIVDDSSIAYHPEKSLFDTFYEPKEDNIHYNLTDGINTSQGEIIIQFKENFFPFAMDDYINVTKSSSIVFQVLQNDNDPDGDNLFVKILTPPKNGIAIVVDSLYNNGSIVDYIKYVPYVDYFGQDSLTYLSIDIFNCSDTANVYFDIKE